MNKETLSQKRVIINNTYGFDPLNSEIHRIVKNGGTVRITGSLSNKNFNQYWKLEGVSEGFSAIYKGSQPGVQGFMKKREANT